MEKLSFTLNELLRHLFAGAIFVASLVLLCPTVAPKINHEVLASFGQAGQVAWLLAILITGSAIYSVHRAILYRKIRAAIIKSLYGDEKTPNQLDIERYHRETQPSWLPDWGAQVHFLYCSGWAIIS